VTTADDLETTFEHDQQRTVERTGGDDFRAGGERLDGAETLQRPPFGRRPSRKRHERRRVFGRRRRVTNEVEDVHRYLLTFN
jgi:hypothetical protein